MKPESEREYERAMAKADEVYDAACKAADEQFMRRVVWIILLGLVGLALINLAF